MANILGKSIGTCVIKDTLVVFTCDVSDPTKDRIYKVYEYSSGTSSAMLLAERTLGFSVNNPIQALPFYESETIQKVYWVDGKNQTRVINVMDMTTIYNNESFDFVKKLALTEAVAITKSDTGGLFKSGTVQYAMTYYNLNGSESNIFYTSPLNYIAPAGRGGAPDEIVANSFSISATGLDTQFSYLRIYSIYRSSKDVISEVKRVVDLSIPASASLTYIDGNTSGSTLSSDVLLYIGGEELIAGCIGQKSNTMFLGNIKTKSVSTPLTLVATADISTTVPVNSSSFSWVYRPSVVLESSSNDTSYPYIPDLTDSSNEMHFKYGETYRLGIQGQSDDGRWSAPMWLGLDHYVPFKYRQSTTPTSCSVSTIRGAYTIDSTLSTWLTDDLRGFKKVRPVRVPLSMSDRSVIAQGVVNNTLGHPYNRKSANSGTSVFSFPDYFFRNNGKHGYVNPSAITDGEYAHLDIVCDYIGSVGSTPEIYGETLTGGSGGKYNMNDSGVDFNSDAFFVDRNIVNFWSPEIEYNESAISPYFNSITHAIHYGYAVQTGRKFDYNYEFTPTSADGTPPDYNADKPNYTDSLPASTKASVWGVSSNNQNVGGVSQDNIIVVPWMPEVANVQIDYHDGGSNEESHMISLISSKNEKSGFNYYGFNTTLNADSNTYRYPITKPKLINSPSSYTCEINSDHNGGIMSYKRDYLKTSIGRSLWVQYGPNDAWGLHDFPDSCTIQYNTANHALFSFGTFTGGQYMTMPRLDYQNNLDADLVPAIPSGWYGTGSTSFRATVTSLNDCTPVVSYTSARYTNPIFDLYKSVSSDIRYGGDTADAITSNQWIPCGPAVNIASGAVVYFNEGDTFFKRFDLKRVFPEDLIAQKPQHTEIVSFMCESLVNTDGRYDTHREETNSTIASSYNNYGAVNATYSQSNNYFNYTALNPLLFPSTEFPVTIAWSNVKTSGSVVDNWTNMTSARSLDLDGVYGAVSSINLINNDLYVFQPKGIARLLYNERISQKASDGLAIEVANGYKVPEYRYITNQYGCSNRDSIVEGKGGIYFIDFINKTLCSIGDGVKDLGYEKGFKSWFNANVTDTKPFTLSYDKMNNDLYIHNEDYCLNYSEVLQLFASFYDYVGIGRMRNIWGKNLSVRYNGTTASGIWIHSDGAYNMFYGDQKPFSVEYTLSPEPTSDKVFNSFEYRLDNRDIDINQVEATNWYQKGKISSSQFSANMKSKFNVNRVLFPRDNDHVSPEVNYPLNRIRSTWAKLKISHVVTTTTNVDKKFVMQDLAVSYSV